MCEAVRSMQQGSTHSASAAHPLAHRKAAEALTLANESRLSMSSPGSCARLITAVSTCAARMLQIDKWSNS